MGRSPRCTKEEGIKRGAWTAAEDKILTDYIAAHGEGKWRSIPKQTGLKRCGKSCRLRWLNYLRPDIKRGNITLDEEDLIIRLHRLLGNRWSLIAGRLPGRTDNEIKNYWNSYLSKQVRRDHKDERHNSLNKHKNANMEPKISTSGPKSEENHQLMTPSPATAVLPPQPPLPLPDDPILHLDFAMNAENLPAMDYESANVSTSPTLSGEDLSPDIAIGLPNFFEPDFSSFYEFGFSQFDLELEGDWSSLQCIEEADISHSGSLECHTAFSYAPDQWII